MTGLTGFRRAFYEAANGLTCWAIMAGIPRPPYTRANGMVIETIGKLTGKRRRIPVGFAEDAGKLIVVVEDGRRAAWVKNALARDGALRIHYHGHWRPAHLRFVDRDPEACLARMGRVHAALVRHHSTTPAVVEITPDPATGSSASSA